MSRGNVRPCMSRTLQSKKKELSILNESKISHRFLQQQQNRKKSVFYDE